MMGQSEFGHNVPLPFITFRKTLPIRNFVPAMNSTTTTTIQRVNETTFICTAPIQARVPTTLSNVQHRATQDASMCQLECMEEGKNKCNAYSFENSTFAPNCTLGHASTFMKPLAFTADPSAVAGYCVSMEDAATSGFFPPFHTS